MSTPALNEHEQKILEALLADIALEDVKISKGGDLALAQKTAVENALNLSENESRFKAAIAQIKRSIGKEFTRVDPNKISEAFTNRLKKDYPKGFPISEDLKTMMETITLTEGLADTLVGIIRITKPEAEKEKPEDLFVKDLKDIEDKFNEEKNSGVRGDVTKMYSGSAQVLTNHTSERASNKQESSFENYKKERKAMGMDYTSLKSLSERNPQGIVGAHGNRVLPSEIERMKRLPEKMMSLDYQAVEKYQPGGFGFRNNTRLAEQELLKQLAKIQNDPTLDKASKLKAQELVLRALQKDLNSEWNLKKSKFSTIVDNALNSVQAQQSLLGQDNKPDVDQVQKIIKGLTAGNLASGPKREMERLMTHVKKMASEDISIQPTRPRRP